MEQEQALLELKELQKKMHAYNHAMALLGVDAATAAPSDSQEGRELTLGVLSQASYDLFVNPKTEELLDGLKEKELPHLEKRQVEELIREYEKISKVPKDEYVRHAMLLSTSEHVWHEAKEKNDFPLFAPYLEKVIASTVKIAGYYNKDKDPYDVLLDLYEPGLTQQKADEFFARLRERVVPLLKKVMEKPPVEDGFLTGDFPVYKQRELSAVLMHTLTIDPAHCVLSETEHPFTNAFNKKDVRVTTKYIKESFVNSMFSVIHEGGHALYELYSGDELEYTSVAGGVSMGIHESQSRFFENIIGRSREFTAFILPKIRELFPALKEVTEEDFYRAINKAEPSLIRIDADELTYPLHIMVRYEIEKKLIKGEISVRELPKVWEEMLKEYLGIGVPSDREGVLQDTHWGSGLIGYFPSYAIGTAYSAQMLGALSRDLSVKELARKGDLKPIVDWLAKRVYRYGKILTPEELLQNCCKEAFDPVYYMDYLEEKFKDIYGI